LYGIGYNLGAAIFSGTASLIATAMIDYDNNKRQGAMLVGLWLSVLSVFSLTAILYVDCKWKYNKHQKKFSDNNLQDV